MSPLQKEDDEMLTTLFGAINLPPAAATLAVIVTVYGVLQGLKKIPALWPYITGWKAIALNGLLTAAALLATIPAEQLYTTNTLLALVTTMAGSAGIHGTVTAMNKPAAPANALKPHKLN